ncbi:MAG: PQQ-binding-like beta-propeller repeat protein [Gemmatimonadetes bacterium]|nr:PQQ-binding-like beta-propeller repeat protein [Gemmatimonadota bacterium]
MTRKHKVVRMLAAGLCLVNACVSVARVGPPSQDHAWRVYLGSALRAPVAWESVSADPQPVWRADLGRGIVGGPALAEDVVAISQIDRQVALLDRATGEVIWRRRLTNNVGAGPLLADDRVFVATQTGNGRAYALRLTNGKSIWSGQAGDVVAPLALGETEVYAASAEGLVTQFSAHAGTRLWRTRVSGAVRTAPVPVPGGVVIATAADSIFLLDRSSGAVRGRRAMRGTVLAAPALFADSLLLVGTTGGRLEALDARTFEVRWGLELGSGVVGSVAVRERSAYALTVRGLLWTVPLDAPQSARRVAIGVVARAGPAPVAGGVFVSGVNGEVALVDEMGMRKWSARLEPPVVEPVIVDGRMVLAVSQRGEVVAFR